MFIQDLDTDVLIAAANRAPNLLGGPFFRERKVPSHKGRGALACALGQPIHNPGMAESNSINGGNYWLVVAIHLKWCINTCQLIATKFERANAEENKKKQDYNHPTIKEATTNNHEQRPPKEVLLGPGRPILQRRCKKTISSFYLT